MKKFISLLLLVILSTTLVSCDIEDKSSDKLSVVTTIFPYYDFANNISNGTCDVEMLLKPGSDVHSFEPTPSDIIKIKSADLFIYNGGESDEWVDTILDSMDDTEKPVIMKMTSEVDLLNEMDADHNEGDEKDEHIWTSLDNAQTLIMSIKDNISKLDNKNKSTYEENCANYVSKVANVEKKISNTVKNSPSKKIIVGDRFPLIYFVNEFNLDWECAFPGCSSETEPSLDRLSKLTDIIKTEKVKTILKLELSENKVADTLADETGTKVEKFYSAETVTKEDFEKNVTYVDLMERNNDAIKEALSR